MFLAISRGDRMNQLVIKIFSSLQNKQIPHLWIQQQALFLGILAQFFILMPIMNQLDREKVPNLKVDKEPVILFILAVLGSFYTLTIYIFGSLHVLTFCAFSTTRLRQLKELEKSTQQSQSVRNGGRVLMKQLTNMQNDFQQFDEACSYVFLPLIVAHFCEIIIFVRGVLTAGAFAQMKPLFKWPAMNIGLTFILLMFAIYFQFKVRQAGRSLSRVISLRAIRPYDFALAERVLFVTSRSLTVLGDVKIGVKLILAVYAPALVVSAFLLRIDQRGPLK